MQGLQADSEQLQTELSAERERAGDAEQRAQSLKSQLKIEEQQTGELVATLGEEHAQALQAVQVTPRSMCWWSHRFPADLIVYMHFMLKSVASRNAHVCLFCIVVFPMGSLRLLVCLSLQKPHLAKSVCFLVACNCHSMPDAWGSSITVTLPFIVLLLCRMSSAQPTASWQTARVMFWQLNKLQSAHKLR